METQNFGLIQQTPPPEGKNFWQHLKENKLAVWIIAISVIVLGIFAYFIFRKTGPTVPTQPKVSISIDAPQHAASGQQIVFRVNIANNETTGIKDLVVDMIYPQGFTITDMNPQPSKLDGSQFTINSLDPGANVSIAIKGTLIGNASESKAINATMHYSFVNFNSVFVVQNQARTQIQNSVVLLQIVGPEKTNAAQDNTYEVDYTNSTTQALSGMKLKLTLPDSFHVSQFNPAPDDSTNNIWNLPAVNPNATGKISVTGNFAGQQPGTQENFSAEVDGSDQQGNPVTLSIATLQTSLIAVPLAADISATSQTSQDASIVLPGDTIVYSINYKNNGSTAAGGVNLSVDINGSAADTSTIYAQNGTVQDNVITWDASQVSDFKSLQPGQGGSLQFQVRIKNPATKANVKNLSVVADTRIHSNEYPQFLNPGITSKVETVPSWTSTAALVSGANPPTPGSLTTFTVGLQLRNSTNDLSNTVVTFNLPNAQSFDMNTVTPSEQANVKWDQGTKQITWNVGVLPAHTGDFNALRKLQFNVTIRPSSSDSGQPMTLANNLKLVGTDSYVSKEIDLDMHDITTINAGNITVQ